MGVEHSDSLTSLEKTNKDTKLATEQQNRENINVLTTKISTALGTKFEQKGLPFDIKAFKLHLNQAVEKVFLNPNIPDIAKEKFKQDILGKIDLLAKVDESDVSVLKYRRIAESLSVELWELWNKTDTEKQAYFLDKILTETIGKYVEPVAYSLEQAFDTREKVGAGEYNQKGVQGLFKKINTLDAAGNAQVGSALTKMLPQGDIANPLDPGIRKRVLGTMLSSFGTDKKEVQIFLRELQFNTFDSLVESYKKFGPIKPSSRPSIFGSNTPESQALLAKIIPYIDAYDEFAGNEKDLRTVRNIALSNDPLGKAKEAIGMEQLKSEFDHLKPANIEEKMKKASFSDMVIMGTQLAQLAPIAGDIGGGFDGIVSALSGMNVQGAKLDALDRWMNGFFGILGITVIGGVAARAQKAGRMAELLRSFGLMKKYMPEKLEAFLKAGGKLGEEAKEGIKKFGKMMGKEVSMKIEQMMLKNGGMMAFTEPMKQFSFQSLVGSRQKAFYETTGGETSGILVRLDDGRIGLHMGDYQGKQIIDICEERGSRLVVVRQELLPKKRIENIHLGNGKVDPDNLYGLLKFTDGKYNQKNDWGKTMATAFFQRNTTIEGMRIDKMTLGDGILSVSYGGREYKFASSREMAQFLDKIPQRYEIPNSEMLKRLDSIKVAGAYIGKEFFASLAKIPTRLWETLERKGVNILFTDAPLTASLDDKWVHSPPRGWEGAKDWSGTGGAYDPSKKRAIVSMMERYRGEHVIYHEYGHAIGDVLGLNHHPELINAQTRLFNKLDKYFQQGGPGGVAGVQEFVAESFSDFMQLPDMEFIKKYDSKLLSFYRHKMEEFSGQQVTGDNFLILGLQGFVARFDVSKEQAIIGGLTAATVAVVSQYEDKSK